MDSLARRVASLPLGTRFALVAATVLAVTLGTVASLTLSDQRRTLNAQLAERGKSIAVLVAKLSVDPLLYKDTLKLDEIVAQAVNLPEVAYTMVADADGRWITTALSGVSSTIPLGVNQEDEAAAVMKALESRGDLVHVSLPVVENDATLGRVSVGITRSTLDVAIRAAARQLLLGFGVALLLVVAVLVVLARYLIRTPLERAVRIAERLAVGDLTARVEDGGQDESGRMLHTMGVLTGSLRETIGDISGSATRLAAASERIATTARQSLSSSESQAAAARETSTAATQLAATVEALKQRASDVGATLKEGAESSASTRQQLDEVVRALDRIKADTAGVLSLVQTGAARAADVAQIAEAVKDIALHTQVLALNAGLEAARAGERGKGFGVVATEIRRLAEQSRDMAAQVASTVGVVQSSMRSAADSAAEGEQRVASTLERVAQVLRGAEGFARQVEESHAALADIVSGVQQQAAGVSQIAAAVHQTRESIEDGLKESQHLEEASKDLAAMGQNLQRLVGKYQLQ